MPIYRRFATVPWGLALIATQLPLSACCAPAAAVKTAPRADALATVSSGHSTALDPRADRSPLHREHPLVGKIYSVHEQRFISPQALLAGIQTGAPLWLGEKHDNPDHHALQGWVIAQHFSDKSCKVAIFEMIDDGQRADLDKFQQTPRSASDSSALAAALQWERSGWPDFALYEPVFAAALDHCSAISPGSFPRSRSMEFARARSAALPSDFAALHLLQTPLPPQQHAAISAEMEAAHCGLLPENMLDSMVFIQRVRDARLAATLNNSATQSAVVVAGNGHVRKDRGGPQVLQQLIGTAGVTVSFQEVVPGADTAQAHAELTEQDPLPYDFVWFTAATDDGDPCEQLRKHHSQSAAQQ